jgi:hypothetical protein
VPVLTRGCDPPPTTATTASRGSSAATLIPVHDQSVSAVSKNYRRRVHRRIRARVEHVTARLKDWQILRQCRRRGQGINHSRQIIAGLWNLKTHKQLRVNS